MNFYFQLTAGLMFNGTFIFKLNLGMTWHGITICIYFFPGIQDNTMKQTKKEEGKEERKKETGRGKKRRGNAQERENEE